MKAILVILVFCLFSFAAVLVIAWRTLRRDRQDRQDDPTCEVKFHFRVINGRFNVVAIETEKNGIRTIVSRDFEIYPAVPQVHPDRMEQMFDD